MKTRTLGGLLTSLARRSVCVWRGAAALGALAVAVRASETIPAGKQTAAILLRGATVHTVSGADLPNTDVYFERGKILKISTGLVPPAGTTVIEAGGKHVYPGFISAFSGMGLVEINSVRGTTDLAEAGAINPNARAQPAINPDSELIPVARSNGVLTALSVPLTQANGLVAGISTLIQLDGWTWEDMTVRASVALHVVWPSMTINRDPAFPRSAEEQQRLLDEKLRRLRDSFGTARAYFKAKATALPMDVDSRWEAMLPVFTDALPVFVHANDVKQIEAAVAWAKQEKFKITIVGGQDAWRVADLLKANDVAVIVSTVQVLPLRREDPFDAPYANPAKLQAAGVRFCIANDGSDAELGTMSDRNLPYLAGKAASYGLPPDEALKSVTLYPAKLLGIDGTLGSIEVGKRATLIVTDGDPLEIATKVELAFIDGAKIDLTNRQTRLYEKYQKKYEQLKAAK